MSVQSTEIQATIFYRHTPAEVQQISRAVIPLQTQIKATSNGFERGSLRLMLESEYFRADESARVCRMLLRAVRYTRAHIQEYFPVMRASILAAAAELEEAVDAYQWLFCDLRQVTTPTE